MFDLAALLRALHEHGVDHVVIGGVAVGAHGYIRATEDLDIVPDPSAENHRRLAELLLRLEATLPTAGGRRFDPNHDLGALRQGQNVSVDTTLGSLDIVQRARGVPDYATLLGDAANAELLGVALKVCSLSHLRQMKSTAARSQDLADLDNLPER